LKRIKLTKYEKGIERALMRGEYRPATKAEFNKMAREIARYRKDAVLNIRINRMDLDQIKRKAERFDIPYQTLISNVLHRLAIQ